MPDYAIVGYLLYRKEALRVQLRIMRRITYMAVLEKLF